MVDRASKKWKKTVKIVMVGKYFVTGEYDLIDSYASVVEALKHAAWQVGVNLEIEWLDSENQNDIC